MTRADRDRAHRQAVEENKARIRRNMRNSPNAHIYGEENYHEARSVRDHVEADALEELMPEIEAHNSKAGGGTKSRVQEHLDKERKREFQKRQRRDAERAREQVEDYARTRPVPNLDKAASMSHGSALASPTHHRAPDAAEEERYEQEMRDYEQRRRQARIEGWLFNEPAPARPGKKGTRQGRPPWA